MSKNDKKHTYKTLVMSNDINGGGNDSVFKNISDWFIEIILS